MSELNLHMLKPADGSGPFAFRVNRIAVRIERSFEPLRESPECHERVSAPRLAKVRIECHTQDGKQRCRRERGRCNHCRATAEPAIAALEPCGHLARAYAPAPVT